MDGRNCSAIEAAGQTRQGCRAKVRGATFKPEPWTNQAWINRLEEFGTTSAPWDFVNAQKLILLVDFCAPQRGPSPPLFLQEYHSREVIVCILQEYHSKWLSGCLFWGAIFSQHTGSTGVASLMGLAPSAWIFVVCKEYHSNGVSSKPFRCACKSIILGRLIAARIVLRCRSAPGTTETRTLENEACGTRPFCTSWLGLVMTASSRGSVQPTKTLLERQFVVWSKRIYILSRESMHEIWIV